MERAQRDAQEILADIEALHRAALADMQELARRIRRRFAHSYGLTQAEAADLLRDPCGREEYLKLLEEIGKLGKANPKRAQLLAKAAAPAYAYRESVVTAMEDEIAAMTARLAEEEAAKIQTHLMQTAVEQSLRSGFRIQQQAGVGFAFHGVSEELARVMIAQPWSGAAFSERVWKNQDALADAMNSVLREGLTTGRSGEAIAQEIAERMNVSVSRARTLVRTETTYVCTQADMAAYEEAQLEEYRFSAVLDMKTSRICQELDGKTFKSKDSKVGVNCPPMHPNCRSTTTCVLSKEDEARMTRLARDPVTGKGVKVPAGMTYKEWLAMQKEIYGEERIAAARKMAVNRGQDKKQLAAYQAVLGKKQPFMKSVQAFQEMKYLNEETYAFVQLDYKRQNERANHPELALPGEKTATAADAKFTGYLFNPRSEKGWPKGVAFTSRLGYNADNWQALQTEILRGAVRYPATCRGTDEYGASYSQEMVLYGLNGTPANVIVGWKRQNEMTWLVTAYLKEGKKGDRSETL